MVCRFRTDTVKISVYGSKHDMGKGMPFPYGYGKNLVYGVKRGMGNGVPIPYGYGKFSMYGVKRGLEMVCRFRTDTVKISMHVAKRDIGKDTPFPYRYFPIQNFPKIFPSRSSVEMSPVISPSQARARRMSMAMKSLVMPWSRPWATSVRLSRALRRAS